MKSAAQRKPAMPKQPEAPKSSSGHAIHDEKARFIPESGFNVVGEDDYEKPGERLYLVAHVESREEADRKVADYQELHPDERYHVYEAAPAAAKPSKPSRRS
jgi:hypothetical protein